MTKFAIYVVERRLDGEAWEVWRAEYTRDDAKRKLRLLSETPGAEFRIRDYSPGIKRVTMAEAQRTAIVSAMGAARGKVEQAASILEIPRSTLYVHLKKLGIKSRDFEGK